MFIPRPLTAGLACACEQDFQRQHGARPARDILDVGCSVGVSTRWLAQEFPAASIVGLDLSPYFLAVAELRERRALLTLLTFSGYSFVQVCDDLL